MKRIEYCREICLCLEARHKQRKRENVVMANEELVGMEQRKKNVHDSFVMHTTWRSFNASTLYDARPLQSPEYCCTTT